MLNTYLGILIDSKLTSKNHVSFISSEISKSHGILTRLRYFAPISHVFVFERIILLLMMVVISKRFQ